MGGFQESVQHTVFGGIVSEFSPFSNWYPCDIQSDDHALRSIEQVYKFRKTVYCGDKTYAVKLLHTTDHRRAKELVSKISGLDTSNWERKISDVMMELVKIKFSHPVLKAELLKTGNLKLVEAGTDRYYSTGLPFTSRGMYSLKKWTGLNKLGILLCDVRKHIKSKP